MSWLNAGDIDFLSPQIYWPSRFTELSKWYGVAVRRFDRHFYPSVTLSNIVNDKASEYIHETNTARQANTYDASGMVFFHYGDLSITQKNSEASE